MTSLSILMSRMSMSRVQLGWSADWNMMIGPDDTRLVLPLPSPKIV